MRSLTLSAQLDRSPRLLQCVDLRDQYVAAGAKAGVVQTFDFTHATAAEARSQVMHFCVSWCDAACLGHFMAAEPLGSVQSQWTPIANGTSLALAADDIAVLILISILILILIKKRGRI